MHCTLKDVHTHALVTKGLQPAMYLLQCEVLSPDLVNSEYSVKGVLLPAPSASIQSYIHLPPSPVFTSFFPSCKLGYCRRVNGLAYLYLPSSVQPATLRCRVRMQAERHGSMLGSTQLYPCQILKVQTQTGKLRGGRLFSQMSPSIPS